jgi:hypothetical protein
MFIEETGLNPGPIVSVPDIRTGNDDGGVAVAKRRKLLVVDRDMLSVGLRRWSAVLAPGLEVNVASYGVRDNSVRIDASLPFLDSDRGSARRKTLEVVELIENMEEASLAADVSLRADDDCRRLARRNMVDTVEVIDGFLWREGVRVGSTWNWDDGRPCVDRDIDASGGDMNRVFELKRRALTSAFTALSR